MRKIWETPGGIHPPEHKTQSLGEPLFELGLPPEIILPVSQHIGAPAEPIVTVGETVLKGQLVAAAAGTFSANVHASTSGTVTAIEDRPLAHPSGLSGLCVVIKPDGKDQWTRLQTCSHYHTLNPVSIIDMIHAAGVVGMGGAGFPTSTKLSSPLKISTLIINGTECEPYITADDILMQTEAENIVEGIRLLDFLLHHPKEILIGIEDNKPKAIEAMQAAVEALGDERICVVPLPVKYPSGGERQLVQMLTGKEIGSGKLPAHIGVICQNVATVLAAYRAVRFGEPLISRITTVTGNSFTTQRNITVRFGTPINYILQQHGFDASAASRLVMGGPMMGFTLLDNAAPIIKTTNCLLAPTVEESPPPQPAQACIRCGMCSEACPASLLPQQLFWYARAEDEEKLRAYNLFDCIECGACSYVCPSSIPLVQYYRAAKGQIKQHSLEKQHSDRARKRFEFHKERIEAEKAERTKAREEAALKAALKAKQRQEEKEQAAAVETGEKTVSTSTEKPQADELTRLTRNLLSTDERLEKLQGKLADLENSAPDQASAVQARINETKLKQQTLQNKIAALSQGTQSAPSNAHISEKTDNNNAEAVASSVIVPDIGRAEHAKTLSPSSLDEAVQEQKKHQQRRQQQLASLTVLQQQRDTTEQRLAATDPTDEDTIAAHKLSLQILMQKINALEVENDEQVTGDSNRTKFNSAAEHGEGNELSDIIAASMERAMTPKNSNALSSLEERIESLKTRLNTAKEKLDEEGNPAAAASVNDAVTSLEQKLEQTLQELEKTLQGIEKL